jgi:hypothetical protein
LILAWICVCILCDRSVEAWALGPVSLATQRVSNLQLSIVDAAVLSSCGWILLALFISVVTICLSSRLDGHRSIRAHGI